VSYLDYPAREFVDELVRENFTFVDLAAKPRRPSKETLERFDTRHLLRSGGEYGAGNPRIRLEQMDLEGIAGEIVHPHAQTNAPPFFVSHSLEVRAAGSRACNRWLADFITAGQGRLFGVAESGPLHDIDAAIEELGWAREHGFVAVSAPGSFPSPPSPTSTMRTLSASGQRARTLASCSRSTPAGRAPTTPSSISTRWSPPSDRRQ
jgi:hypothetical protein